MNIHTRQLEAFLHVARLQSFTKAAERVHLSQAGLSMMIKELEAQVGGRLFDRTTRSVTLTEAGRRLQPVATRLLEELDLTVDAVGAARSRALSTLRIAATPLLSSSLLPRLFSDFQATHPHVAVHLADVELGEVLRLVMEEEADMGLGFFIKPAVGLLRAPVFRFRLMRVAPVEGGKAGLHGSVPWTSLRNARLLSLPSGNPIQSLIDRHLATVGIGDGDRPAVNFFGTLIGMVEAGLGTAVIPSFALADCLRHQVMVDMLTKPTAHIDLYVASRRGAPLKPAAHDFTEALKRAIPSLVMHD